MKRNTSGEHQTPRPAKAAKKGEVEDAYPSPHNAFTEGVENVNGQLASNNAAFLGNTTIPPTFPFSPLSYPWAPPHPYFYFYPTCPIPMKPTVGMPSHFFSGPPRVGSIYPGGDKEGDEKEYGKTKVDEELWEDEKENDEPLDLKIRNKCQKRLDALKRNKEEREKRKEELYNLGQSFHLALENLLANRKGLNVEVAKLKVEIASIKAEQSTLKKGVEEMGKDFREVHTSVKEVHTSVGKILEFMERNGGGERK